MARRIPHRVGPRIPRKFAYDGTPYPIPRASKFNRLDREVIQDFRFYNGHQNGTHKLKPDWKNVPRNSNRGRGVGGGGYTNQEL